MEKNELIAFAKSGLPKRKRDHKTVYLVEIFVGLTYFRVFFKFELDAGTWESGNIYINPAITGEEYNNDFILSNMVENYKPLHTKAV